MYAYCVMTVGFVYTYEHKLIRYDLEHRRGVKSAVNMQLVRKFRRYVFPLIYPLMFKI